MIYSSHLICILLRSEKNVQIDFCITVRRCGQQHVGGRDGDEIFVSVHCWANSSGNFDTFLIVRFKIKA